MTTATAPDRAIRVWLWILVAMVFTIVAVGGLTRLTESGLSIVEWNVVMGTLPPLSEEHWQSEFAKYQQFPQYQTINRGMSLGEFKFIYFWEWFHRFIGRMIGLTALLPLVYFQVRRRISRPLARRMWGAFALVCVQGALGWFMVKSGLVERPRVSHFRLAAHLSLAFFLAAYLVWTLQSLRHGPRRLLDPAARGALGLLGLIYLQIVYGAFVAGLRAGYGFNTFPLMNGELFPTGFLREEGGSLLGNLLYNTVSVQFVHRTLGWVVLVTVLAAWFRGRKALAGRARALLDALAATVTFQFLLGVATLVLVVPIPLATLHQVTACLLFCLAAAYAHSRAGERA